VGSSELAEIAVIVATEIDVQIVAIIDSNMKKPRILGIPAVKEAAAAVKDVDAVMITSIAQPRAAYEDAVSVFGAKHVYLPSVLANLVARAERASTPSKKRTQK
jgi:ribosomal protein S2